MFYLNNLPIGDRISFYNILLELKNVISENVGNFRKYIYRNIDIKKDPNPNVREIAQSFNNISNEIIDFVWHDGIDDLVKRYGNGDIKNVLDSIMNTHIEYFSLSYRPIKLDFLRNEIAKIQNLILGEKRRKLRKIVSTAVAEISSVLVELYNLFEKKSFLSCVLLTDDEFKRFMKLGNDYLFNAIYRITNELLPIANYFLDLDENKNDYLAIESAVYHFHDVLERQEFKHDLLNLMLLRKELDSLFFTAMSVFPYYIVEEKEYYKRVFGIYRESVLKIEQLKVNLVDYFKEIRKLAKVV